MYKKSFYNLEIEQLEKNKVLMYNTLSGSIGIMDERGKNIYDNIDNIDSDNLETEYDTNILTTMLDNGFIVKKDFDEFNFYKLLGDMGRFNTNSFGLTIATTLDCNMACPYCYEEHQKIYMSRDTADKIFNFFKSRIDNIKIKHLDVTWYGGEPLLNLDIIEYLSEKFINLCNDNNIFYSAFIVTNGVLLDRKTAEILKKYHVNACQITIDGPKEINDTRRLLLDGSSSFDIISENLKQIKDLINVSIRCNIDKTNVNSIEYLVDYFKSMGISIHTAPVDKSTDICEANLDDCFSPHEFKDIEMITVNKYYNENHSITDYILPSLKTLGCGAMSNNSYVVDPEGDLVKCWNYVGDKSKVIGNVHTGEILNPENIKWLTLNLDTKCKTCKLLPTCAGGCPDTLIREGKSKCNYKKYNLNQKLILAYEKYISDKCCEVNA